MAAAPGGGGPRGAATTLRDASIHARKHPCGRNQGRKAPTQREGADTASRPQGGASPCGALLAGCRVLAKAGCTEPGRPGLRQSSTRLGGAASQETSRRRTIQTTGTLCKRGVGVRRPGSRARVLRPRGTDTYAAHVGGLECQACFMPLRCSAQLLFPLRSSMHQDPTVAPCMHAPCLLRNPGQVAPPFALWRELVARAPLSPPLSPAQLGVR